MEPKYRHSSRQDEPPQLRHTLTRYDSVSLRPISLGPNGQIEPPIMQMATFPRISAQLSDWSHYGTPQHQAAVDEQFARSQEPPVSVQPPRHWPSRLQRNHHLTIHRIAFIFLKFPAMLMGLIGALILFGKRGTTVSIWPAFNEVEWRAGAAAMGTAGIVLASLIILGQQNHWNSLGRAKIQVHWRVFFSLLGIFLFIATGVFSAIALDRLRFVQAPGEEEDQTGPLNRHQRIIYFAILIAICVIKLILASFTVIHGVQAILRIERDQNQLRNSLKASSLMARRNGGFGMQTDLY